MDWLKDFFHDLDDSWKSVTSRPIKIQLLGSTALMVQTNYERGTKDTDVLHTSEIGGVSDQLRELAGKNSKLHKRYQAYLDIVPNGLPFLPRPHLFHPIDLGALKHFAVSALDVTDVVVSKLKRFHADDVEDIKAMVLAGNVTHGNFISRFRSAFEMEVMNGNDDALKAFIRNLNTVERDFFDVPESSIKMNDWPQ